MGKDLLERGGIKKHMTLIPLSKIRGFKFSAEVCSTHQIPFLSRITHDHYVNPITPLLEEQVGSSNATRVRCVMPFLFLG